MTIDKQTSGEATILKVSGEIDLHASPDLREALHLCIEEKKPIVLVDFSEVDYIDSSGLATLIEYARESTPTGGKFGLFGLQKKVRAIFDLVRLNELFVIEATADEALASIAVK